MATTENLSDLDDFEYRPLSSSAIAAAIFGVLSLLMFAAGGESLQSSLMLSPIPIVGLVVGLIALAKIRSMPNQLSGSKVAVLGVVLSAIGLVGGLSYAGYVHATEVPDGYVRIPFYELRPDEVEVRNGHIVPEAVQQLEGQKVFIKGYMRPGTSVTQEGSPVRRHARHFLLVRDNNECCFGDQSKVKYYDQVFVTMAGSRTADDSRRLIRAGGTLRSMPQNLRQNESHPVYLLEVDYLQ
ncbi:MAG: DUF4190 domain-containing protein [Planctomycetes bacterium]|nr:DUF4190 domain-containing protein [Planctomycetota bacterium]